MRRLATVVALAVALCLSFGASAQDPSSQFSKAVSLYRDGKMDEALAAFEQAAKLAPTEPLVWNWIGFIHLRRASYADACKPLEEAVRLRPNYGEAWTNLGNAYLNTQRTADAAEAFRKATHLDPNNLEIQYNEVSLLEA